MIEVEYNEYKETIEENMKLIQKNHKLKEEIERLNSDYLEMKDNFRVANDEIERLNKALRDIKYQLEYLETYSSKEDVYEDMSRRLNNIESIVNKALGSDKE